MIELLLPSGAVAVEAFADVPGETVFPGEEDLIVNSVESRRREFVTARRCARQALAALGHPPAPIRSGPKREPQWPAGLVGSITHCAGFRAAAVAPRTSLAGLGIDAEPHQALPAGVLESVTVAGESEMIDLLSRRHPATHWDKVLFSAKESVYKAWFPLTRRWLGFEDARLGIDPIAGTFTARLTVDGTRADGATPLSELAGRFLVGGGLIVTTVTVSAKG